MAYSDYDSQFHHRSRHDSYYQRSRDSDGYSRHAQSTSSAREGLTAMKSNADSSSYRTYEPRYDYVSRSPAQPKRSSAHPPYQSSTRKSRWPPSPSVEDETVSLAKEFPSSVGSVVEEDGGEAIARGSADQYHIIEEIEHPKVAQDDDRRFVLVTDPGADDGRNHAASDRRRKSFAERGNMAPLKTDIDDDPPVFTKRTSTPYAYTKPQKESLAPSAASYFLSPEPITPSSSSVPRSVPSRDLWEARDESAKPSRTVPIHTRYDSLAPSQSPKPSKNDVFDDSDTEPDTNYLHTAERKPARYSFTKSDFHKEDLRTNILDSQAKSEKKPTRDSVPPRLVSRDSYTSSSGSSKHPTPQSQSPRSSSSSLHGESRRSRPAPVETGTAKSSRYPDSRPPSRPSSPLYRNVPSPPRSPGPNRNRPASPTTSRPSSRAGARPSSPRSSFKTMPQPTPRSAVTETDWHATYPPTSDRSRTATRYDRSETIPVPRPRIDIQSPSPARPPTSSNPLPYPVDDRPTEAFMPPEERYQFDHSSTPIATSPRQPYPESPVAASPRERPSAFRPTVGSRHTASPDELPRSPRIRSDSMRSHSSHDGRRERKTTPPASLDRPLPSCPRSEPSSRYNDWYTLQNCPSFDMCPSCYEDVFADTPFAVYFSQTRRYERPVERVCDFSSPWMRLAWLLTIKQRRQSPDLLYQLATITESDRQCPGDRELSTDHVSWYGIPDQRDGIHVANFAICPCDLNIMEALFPSIRGYFTRLPSGSPYAIPGSFTCSLRVNSRRFPKYLDLLVELDSEAQLLGQRPNITRFVQLTRENAFKNECQRDKAVPRKLWHFMPKLPDLTVCQECYEDLIWPAIAAPASTHTPATIPNLFNRTVQPVPAEDPELGSSCCLYSPRMRKIWDRSVQDEDFTYLKRKAAERKRAELRLGRERKNLLGWMATLDRSSVHWEDAKADLKDNEGEWKEWE